MLKVTDNSDCNLETQNSVSLLKNIYFTYVSRVNFVLAADSSLQPASAGL